MVDFLIESLPVMGVLAAWLVTACLLALGLVGTLVPFLPGHLILFFAAVGHWLMLRGESGVEWWTFVVLGLLLALSQVFEFLSGAMGTTLVWRHALGGGGGVDRRHCGNLFYSLWLDPWPADRSDVL